MKLLGVDIDTPEGGLSTLADSKYAEGSIGVRCYNAKHLACNLLRRWVRNRSELFLGELLGSYHGDNSFLGCVEHRF